MLQLAVEVTTSEQKVRVRNAGETVWECACSTSEGGTGEASGSYKTPTGRFHIAEKIGAGAEIGTVFKSRIPTGLIWTPQYITEEDLILTRILWLAGDEPHNANTKERYIYFHGTNHESTLGIPASHGCIRLSNMDIITLFDLVEIGTAVHIHES